jgi:tRNA A-37 threonylcarbamoyl transferase component Bud32
MDTVKMDAPMPDASKCPQCGTPLPTDALAGLCPACLLKLGAAADTITEAKQPAFNPPDIVELVPLFPQLEILELIGKGGMGAVYKARQKQLDRIVALKILPPGIGHDAAFAERFAREAKALAKLNHPNIVTLYEFGDAGGQFYFLMEFVDGVNLRQLLAGSRISAREALAIVPQICDALQFAHDQGIVHRDIKPENILLDRRGRVKVADFGLAKIIEPGRADLLVSQSGEAAQQHGPTGVMGTPQYMSPEQVHAPGEVDNRADIYALGVVFYQMLTGELPGKKIEAPSKKVQIDVRLDEIVLRALEKNPGLRYQQVSEVKTMVETIVSTPGSAGVPPADSGGSRGVEAQTEGEKSEVRSQKPEVEPRFSRTAIVGACWVPLFFITFVLNFTTHAVQGEYHGPAWWQVLLLILLVPTGFTAPFGTTILGWVAVSQIRRSTGKLYGLWLAVFDGLFFPLLVVDGAIAWLWVVLAKLFARQVLGLQNSLFLDVWDLTIWVSLALASLALVDWLIIRIVWRAANEFSASQQKINKPMNSNLKNIVGYSLAGLAIVACVALAVMLVAFLSGLGHHQLTVKAFIDSSDVVKVSGNRLWFEHETGTLPGRNIFVNGKAWSPSWTNNVSAEFLGLNPAFRPRDPQKIQITKRVGRGTVSIAQFPSPANDETLAVRIDDVDFGGADWYEVVISW